MPTPDTQIENGKPLKMETIDKNIYSHGEPMDVSENVTTKEPEIIDEPMQVCKNVSLNEVGEVSVTNGVDGSGMSSDEMTLEESSKMEKAYKTRRRRKEIANSYL